MAKRLSKALRGKRRWVGIECSAQFESRKSLEHHLHHTLQSLEIEGKCRLMDFHAADSQEAVLVASKLELGGGRGFAILEVPHPAYQAVRECFGAEDSLDLHGIHTLTSSGKIRLVRERMWLPRPNRNR